MQSKRISPKEAHDLMEQNPNAIILDVRTPKEFAQGKIPGAILLPDYEIKEKATLFIPEYDSLVLIYCKSGIRSAKSLNLLLNMGYINVYDFGGIVNWPYAVQRCKS